MEEILWLQESQKVSTGSLEGENNDPQRSLWRSGWSLRRAYESLPNMQETNNQSRKYCTILFIQSKKCKTKNNNKNQSKRLSSHHEHENYSSTIRLTYQIVLTYYVLVLIFFMNFFVFFFFCFFICFILFFVFLTTSYDYVWGKWNGFGCLRLLKRWIRRR